MLRISLHCTTTGEVEVEENWGEGLSAGGICQAPRHHGYHSQWQEPLPRQTPLLAEFALLCELLRRCQLPGPPEL
jgi:hypothetical protein